MNIYWDSLGIYLNLLRLREKSKGILTVDVVEDFTKAAEENREAITDCEETLNRPFVDYNPIAEAQACLYNEVL